jgi:hypothetical protein
MKPSQKLEILGLGVVFSLVLAGAAFWLMQDQIAIARLKPAAPFDVIAPPPAPDYADRRAWGAWPEDPAAGAADVFFVHSTTSTATEEWNASITGAAAARARDIALPVQAAPLGKAGAVYAPHYRQATLFAELRPTANGRAALEFAYDDIEAAFDKFLAMRSDDQRPIIIAGYGQGGVHALGLLQKRFSNDQSLRDKLAAAYLIDSLLPASLLEKELQLFPLCAAPSDTGCIISFISIEKGQVQEKRRLSNFAFYWDDGGALQVISAPAIACIYPKETERKIAGGACADGFLSYARPADPAKRTRRWFGQQWRLKRFNLFGAALAQDAARRAETTAAKLAEESMILEPIGEAVDLVDSPVNKVRE